MRKDGKATIDVKFQAGGMKLNFNDGWYFKRLDEGVFKNIEYGRDILSAPAVGGCNEESTVGNEFCAAEYQMSYKLEGDFADELINSGDIPWTCVSLPHTARIENLVTGKSGEDGDASQQWQGTCWYSKKFNIDGSMKNKKVYIKFDGAMNVADIWFNGRHMVRHMGGFLPIVTDVSKYLDFDNENEVVVRLDNRDNEITGPKPLKALDFNMYHGLYRNVYLIVKDPLHITDPILANIPGSGDVFVKFPKVGSESAEVLIKTHIINEYAGDKAFKVRALLTDREGNIAGTAITEEVTLAAGHDVEAIQTIIVNNPNLWSVKNPYLYNLKVEIICNGETVDSEDLRIGIRSIKITKDGFWLNGEKMYLRGANRHQEYPYIGYAVPDNAQYRDAKRIKEAGFDYIRLSHYPQFPAFMDACDELGLMVMDCIPGWQFFREGEFARLQYQNCRDMIRRDRNHPCVLLWEVSLNETRMPAEFIKQTHRIAHEEYPGDQCYTCGWMEGYDVFGQARQHGGCHKVQGRPCVVTEYGDWEYYAQNAGFNQDKWEDLKDFERNSRQLRGDGEKRLLQQATNYQEAHNDNRTTIAFADSIWVMYDYNRGYAPDLEASGIMDIMRIPKFSYYFFQSQRDPDEKSDKANLGPMVYIANYWTENSPLDVRVFSNCDEVSLYLNDRLIETRKPDNDKFSTHLPHPPFTFVLPGFEPGTLRAEGYIKGKKCAEFVRMTPDKAAKLELSMEEGTTDKICENDIIFIYANVTDEKGTTVPDADNTVRFSVSGPARLIGQNPIKAEAGIGSVLLQICGGSGEIKLTAEADGLKAASMVISL